MSNLHIISELIFFITFSGNLRCAVSGVDLPSDEPAKGGEYYFMFL